MSIDLSLYSYEERQKLITDHIARVDRWLRELPVRRLPDKPPEETHKASTTLEELRIAEEELRAQNEFLREAQHTIEAERERYRALFAEAPDGYIVTDSTGVIQAANQAAALMLNRPPHLLIGKPLLVHISMDRRPAFRDLHDKFAKAGAIVVGVSRDSVKSHQGFATKMGFPFPLISDADETVCNLYGVIKQKNMYGKQVRGIERSTFLIDAYGVLVQEWRGVKVPGHAKEVLQAAKSIG